jgi:3-deoxy-D-manno-octulosonate 8-phosphate phosphatase (KDO 8-P phosphatase)
LKKKKINFNGLQLLVLDVDGVLTDGTLIINADGSESKAFNALDGHGIRMWRKAGLKVAFLSGRKSGPTAHRAKQIGADFCLEDCHDKLEAFENLLEQDGIAPEMAAFVGDDLPDLPVMRCAGFSAAVANAVEQVKANADYITKRKGGNGAVREVIEYILKKKGKWQELLKRYLPEE